MDFSKEQADRVMAFIKSKWSPTFSCPCCGSKDWQATPKLFQVTEYVKSSGIALRAGSVFPVIPVMCTNCGYTLLINALIAGITIDDKRMEETVAYTKITTPPPNEEKKTEVTSG